LHDHFRFHLEVHDRQRAASVEQPVERLGLRHRPRKPVQEEAARRVGLVEPLSDERDDGVIVHQAASREDALDRTAEGRALRDALAQHVAGGNLRNGVRARVAGGLRALARPGQAEHDDVTNGHNPSGLPDALPRPEGRKGKSTASGYVPRSRAVMTSAADTIRNPTAERYSLFRMARARLNRRLTAGAVPRA